MWLFDWIFSGKKRSFQVNIFFYKVNFQKCMKMLIEQEVLVSVLYTLQSSFMELTWAHGDLSPLQCSFLKWAVPNSKAHCTVRMMCNQIVQLIFHRMNTHSTFNFQCKPALELTTASSCHQWTLEWWWWFPMSPH